ncbi:MAG: hypothetical protein ACOYLX_23020 [Burkholderiaceae bacterium]
MTARWTQEGLDAFVRACAPTALRFRVPLEAVRNAAQGLPMLTFFVDNQPVGAAVFTGSETHLSIEPEYHGRWLTPKALRELRNALVRCPKAKVRTDNAVARRFVERFGMRLVSDSNGWAKYELPTRTA